MPSHNTSTHLPILVCICRYQPEQKETVEATSTEWEEIVADGEVDELLEWAHGLNYDE